MDSIDFLNRDFKHEMVNGLRDAAGAIQSHGYRLYNYGFRTPMANEPQAWNKHDPEQALEAFLEKMQDSDRFYSTEPYFNTDIRSEPVADLFENGTADSLEETTNELLRQINGQIDIGEPEEPELHPLHQEVDIIYQINTQGNYFEIINYDGEKGEQFATEVEDILEEEGFNVRNTA